MRRGLGICALTVLVTLPMAARADSFTLNSLSFVVLNPSAEPFPISFTGVLTQPYSFSLDVGQTSAPSNIISVTTSGDNKIKHDYSAQLSVTFNITVPGDATSSTVDVAGIAVDDVPRNNNDTLTIQFADPVHFTWGLNGSGQLDVDLSDILDGTIHNGNGYSGNIQVTFHYANAATQVVDPDPVVVGAVPEPASLVLLGSGLVGLALLAYRRKD